MKESLHIPYTVSAYGLWLFILWMKKPIYISGKFFVVSPCLQVSATVRLFLPGWVDLKKKRRNYVSRGNFGMDATPKAIKVLQFLSHGKIQKLNITSRYFRTCFFSLYIFWQIMKNHVFCYSFSCVTDCETRLCHLLNLFIRYTMYHFLYWK